MTATELHPPAEKGEKEEWLICSDKDEDKQNLMNIIIKLRLKKQHSLGRIFYADGKPKKDGEGKDDDNQKETLAGITAGHPGDTQDNINGDNTGIHDGRWIILQDWSQCTLKCGGGLQYLQLICVPPQKGGKECVGEAVRTRKCNEQPCPKPAKLTDLLKKNGIGIGGNHTIKQETIEKPIVKMMAVSTRPQRYDKCYLKDTDALMVKNDKETKDFDILPKIPIRLVMNNKSISVYQDESLQTNLMTFMLRNTQFKINADNPRCFYLKSLASEAEFCQLDSGNGDFVAEWNFDFNLFKEKCKEKREVIELKASEQKKLQADYKAKVEQINLDMVQETAKKVKQSQEVQTEKKLEEDIEKTQAMSFTAVQKELKLEEMLEKEESQREANEEREMRLQIEAEKKKNDCLSKSIQEKEIENQMNTAKAEAGDTIKKIKEEAKKQIEFKRNIIKQKLETMRKKSKRRLADMQNDIINIRVETAKKVSSFAKDGNEKACYVTEENNLLEYCAANFTDAQRFTECNNKDNFCIVCCGNEFGELHVDDRTKCEKGCSNPTPMITEIAGK